MPNGAGLDCFAFYGSLFQAKECDQLTSRTIFLQPVTHQKFPNCYSESVNQIQVANNYQRWYFRGKTPKERNGISDEDEDEEWGNYYIQTLAALALGKSSKTIEIFR